MIFQTYPDKPLAYVWFYARPYLRQIVFAVLFITGLALTNQFSTYYFSRIIDALNDVIKGQGELAPLLVPLMIWMTVFDVFHIVCQRSAWLMLEKSIPPMTVQINKDVCQYIVGHSAEYLSNQHSGKLGGRPGQLSDNVADVMMICLFGFCSPLVNFIFTFIMLMNVNRWVALLLLFWSAVIVLFLGKSARKLRPYSADVSEKNAVLHGRIVDVIMNALTVKSFSNLKYEEKTMAPYLRNVCQADTLRMHKMQNGQAMQSVIVLLFNLSMILTALFLWHQKLISTGQIVLVVLLVNTVVERLFHILYELMGWNRTLGRIENALNVVATRHGITDMPQAKKFNTQRAEIEFQNVNFGYREKGGVFKCLNLKIRAGEKVGLVGMSGSGKTTIINLLQRFYDVQGGQILINGHNIQQMTQDSLHQNIAVIPQDTSLFHRSLYENIAYGRPYATKKEILSASKQAYAHEFIIKAEKGYDTLVGDRGIKLSGGQRQRIAIARAILKKAPILILDEATSALDSESEQHIQKSLKQLMRGKTVIAIAHRLSTLKEMDRIIVMSKGRIIEDGRPAQLLKKKGKYAKLWALQTQIKPPTD